MSARLRPVAAAGLGLSLLGLPVVPAEAACVLSARASAAQLRVTLPDSVPVTTPGTASSRARQQGPGENSGSGRVDSFALPLPSPLTGSASSEEAATTASARVAGSTSAADASSTVERATVELPLFSVIATGVRTEASAGVGTGSPTAQASVTALLIDGTSFPLSPGSVTVPGGVVEIAPRETTTTAATATATAAVARIELDDGVVVEIGRVEAAAGCL